MKVFIIALIFSACVMAQTPLPSPYAASLVSSGTITSITAGCGLSGGTITTSGTIAESVTVTAHNGSYAILTGDCGKALTTNTTASWTLAQAGSAGFASGWATQVNVSSGTLTITTTTSNFYGASGASATTLTITGPAGATITSDGTNWLVQAGGSGTPSFTAITSGTNTTAAMTVGSGASLAAAGSGSITATAVPASGLTGQVSGANGGTGVNNGTSTITVGGNVTFSGAYTFNGTLNGNTNVTFPTSGTLATTALLPSCTSGQAIFYNSTPAAACSSDLIDTAGSALTVANGVTLTGIMNSIGTTMTDLFIAENNTAATSGIPSQDSPAYRMWAQSYVPMSPGSFATANACTSGGNITTGQHYYKVTFTYTINGVSGETGANYTSSPQTCTSGNGTINLTSITTQWNLQTSDYITGRKIYRTLANASPSSTYYLVATIPDNTTTSYTDTLADGSLGAALNPSTVYQSVPTSWAFRTTAQSVSTTPYPYPQLEFHTTRPGSAAGSIVDYIPLTIGLNGSNVIGQGAIFSSPGDFDFAPSGVLVLRPTSGPVYVGVPGSSSGGTMILQGSSVEVQSPGYFSIGTKFTVSGCSAASTVGGATAGTFVAGVSGTCTATITMNGATGLTAPHGWTCAAYDLTTPANLISQSGSSATTCTITGSTTAGDTINFLAMAY